jgi:aminopeptidase-like protein
MALLWVLNLADGRHSLLDIAERAGLTFGLVAESARLLQDSGLLVEVRHEGQAPRAGMQRNVA